MRLAPSSVDGMDTGPKLPPGVQVKNTFLDLVSQTSGDWDSEIWDDLDVCTLPRRVMTEPAPITQGASSASSAPMDDMSNRAQRDERKRACDSSNIASGALCDGGREQGEDEVGTLSSSQHMAEQQNVLALSSSPSSFGMGDEIDLQVTASNQQTRAMTLAAQLAAQAPATSSRISDWGDAPFQWQSITTVMMTCLPRYCHQQSVLDVLNADGFAGTFDFCHLPRGSATPVNARCCFINFVDPCFAWLLKLMYDGKRIEQISKTLVYIREASVQGLDASLAYFACDNCRDPSERPILFRETSESTLRKSVNFSRESTEIEGGMINSVAQKRSGSQREQPAGIASSRMHVPKARLLPRDSSQGSDHALVKSRASKMTRARKFATEPLPRASQRTSAHRDMTAHQDSAECSGNTPQPRFCVYCGGELSNPLPTSKCCSLCGTHLTL